MSDSPAAPRRLELWRGARDSLPMLIGAAPFGVIFGTLAAPSDLSAWGALAMSLLVYAGSAQFVALSLFKEHAGLAVIVMTTLVINLRHALYSATLLPQVSHLPQRWRIPLAFGLTDESFAVVQQRQLRQNGVAASHWYFLGSVLAMYLNWQLWTVVGVALGRSVEGLDKLGLDFAMVATFVGIVVPLLKTRPMLAAALCASAVALAGQSLPYRLGLVLAALTGVVMGLLLEKRTDHES
ncbi:AzlC family ABC transporter permease [Chitinimonas lacunae]|uniref:AzlC family ABC transporter permease n=1 Tax=Chitinimonas lacunae TaxID=1963018 RepID=A0ABV8MLL4_9NEIS